MMNGLNLEWLRTFKVFSESKNIIDAAKTLNISQPAVTVHLKNLESCFQQKLFLAIGRKKELTPFGHKVYEFVSQSLYQMEVGLNELELFFEDPAKEILRIGGKKELLEKILVHHEFTGRTTIAELDNKSALNELKKNNLDIVFSTIAPNANDFVAKAIYEERPVLAFHKKWLKSYNKNKIFSEKNFFLNTPALFYKKNPPYFENLLASLKINQHHLEPKLVMENWNVISKKINDGLGYSIVPSSYRFEKNIITLDLPNKLGSKMIIYAIYSAELKNKANIKAFLN